MTLRAFAAFAASDAPAIQRAFDLLAAGCRAARAAMKHFHIRRLGSQ